MTTTFGWFCGWLCIFSRFSFYFQPLSLKRLTEGLKATKRSDDTEIYKLFTNVLCIHPPKVNVLVLLILQFQFCYTYLVNFASVLYCFSLNGFPTCELDAQCNWVRLGANFLEKWLNEPQHSQLKSFVCALEMSLVYFLAGLCQFANCCFVIIILIVTLDRWCESIEVFLFILIITGIFFPKVGEKKPSFSKLLLLLWVRAPGYES